MKKNISLVSAAVALAFAATANAEPSAPPALGAPAPTASATKTACAPATPADCTKPDVKRVHRVVFHHHDIAPYRFDFHYSGDVAQALDTLQRLQPQLTVLGPLGKPTAVPVQLDLHRVTLDQALQSIGDQGGDRVDVVYNGANHTARLAYRATSAVQTFGSSADAEARRWQDGQAARPIMGPNGLLEYPFGEGQPVLTCSPLRACDIQLQAGEVINNVILGDTVRWVPAPATTGEGANAVQHVIVKPTETGLTTNLLVTTNRRTYEVTLKSSATEYVSRIGWYYPADIVQDWNGAAQLAARKAAADAKQKVSDMPIINFDQLNLDGYKIKGDKHLAWYPVRVFDDGTHVYIQMPASIHSSDAPALVLFDQDGHSELVNYRVKEADQGGEKVTYYVVDKLFTRAGLIVGVGSEQKKVEIDKIDHTASTGQSWFSRNDFSN